MGTNRTSRRNFLKAVGASAVGATVGIGLAGTRAKSETRELVIAGWGGLYEDSCKKAFFDPFNGATGVKIRQVSAVGGMYTQLKAQVETNNPEIDIFSPGMELVIRGGRAGLLVPIDTNVVDTSRLYSKAVNKFGIAFELYSVGLAYSTLKYPAGTQPKSYRDFWDIQQFPARRTMPGWTARDNMEAALLADGVPADKLYPLDVDRAFRKLQSIKPQVTWYNTGAQMTQLFADKEVDLGFGYLGRVNVLARQGAPVATQFNQAIYSFTCWAVSKVSRNREVAMQFINFASQAKQQAARSLAYPEGPINRDAWSEIPEKLQETLPKYDTAGAIFRDDDWWEASGAKLEERWKLWLAS